MQELGLAETIEALRLELEASIASSDGQDLRFFVGPIQVELQLCVRREAGLQGKAKFWVIEAGADGKYAHESIQKVTLTLEPVGKDGTTPIQVHRGSSERP
ncbi:trypco2 family protein [Streptomyces sp. NPDC016309]|uniref:trypco2 family protein n=1 Tax=Streptomyces sp. NPDC016309 TaxID=3364965 RepID=UPI0036F83CE8